MMPAGRRSNISVMARSICSTGTVSVPNVSTVTRHRPRDADGVRQVDLAAFGQAGGDDVLGHPARRVRRRAVDLGRILAGEGAAAVACHAAVGVDDDLAAGQAGVAEWTADHEATGRVDEVLGLFVEQVSAR